MRKFLAEVVQTSLMVTINPGVQVLPSILATYPAEVWTALSSKYFSHLAHDKYICRAISRTLEVKTEAFIEGAIDILQDKMDVKIEKCDTCKSTAYSFKTQKDGPWIYLCLNCASKHPPQDGLTKEIMEEDVLKIMPIVEEEEEKDNDVVPSEVSSVQPIING
jgi:hypothetical protein